MPRIDHSYPMLLCSVVLIHRIGGKDHTYNANSIGGKIDEEDYALKQFKCNAL